MSVNIYNSNPNASSEAENFQTVASRGSNLAGNMIYDNTNSDLTSVNVQDAIDEIDTKVENNADAISQINTDLSNITPSADGVHFKFGVTRGQEEAQIGTVTFDTPFPDANYNVFLTVCNPNTGLIWTYSVITKTATGFTFRTAYTAPDIDWTNYFNDIQWLAIR